jgi:hypothetical protein
MQRSPIPLCVSIAALSLCGVWASITTAKPREQATPTAGDFSHVRINQPKGAASALDIYPTGGKAVRFFSWEPKQIGPRTYFNDVSMLYSQGWVTISGTMKGEGIKDESGQAAAHPISVRASDTETIDGEAMLTISTNHGVLRVISSGTNWLSM